MQDMRDVYGRGFAHFGPPLPPFHVTCALLLRGGNLLLVWLIILISEISSLKHELSDHKLIIDILSVINNNIIS